MDAANCSSLSPVYYKVASSLRVTTAGLSFFCSLASLTVIVLFKKYLFMTQRLILYLCISVALSSLVRTINIAPRVYNSKDPAAETFCFIAGFLDEYTLCSVIFAVTSITVDVFIVAVFMRKTRRLEPIYFVVIFLSPIFFSWIPFINNTYGDAGAWCWIRTVEVNCTTSVFGVVLQFTLLYVPILVIMLLLVLILLITLTVLYMQRYKYDATFDPNAIRNRRMVRKEVKQLIWYPIIFIFINIVPAINRLVTINQPDNPRAELLILSAFIGPLQGVFVTLAFVLDPETRKRLTWMQIRGAISDMCSRASAKVQEYPAVMGIHSDSLIMDEDEKKAVLLSTDYKLVQ